MNELAVANRRKRLRFGALAAEDDRTALRKNFLELDDFSAVRYGKKNIIIGPKGAGKTALRYWLQDQHQDEFIWIDISPDEIGWAEIVKYSDCGIAPVQAKKAAWLALFVRECLERLDDVDGSKAVAGEIQAILVENGFESGKAGWALSKVGVAVAGLSLEFGKGQKPGGQDFGQFLRVLKDCIQLIDEVLRAENREVRILVDQLDEHWYGRPEESLTLEALLLAVRDIANKTEQVTTQVFLRTDIWSRLVFNDKDKLKANIFQISWKDRELLALIAQRIRGSTGLTTGKDDFVVKWAFDEYVTGVQGQGGKRPTIRFILDNIQRRPRDLQLVCELARQARPHGDQKIGAKDVLKAIDEYSYQRLDNIQNAEAAHTVPEMATLLQGLKGARSKITWRTLEQRIQDASGEFAGREQELLGALLEYEVIGFANPVTTFYGDDPHLLQREVKKDTTFKFHPALRTAMSIKGVYGGAE